MKRKTGIWFGIIALILTFGIGHAAIQKVNNTVPNIDTDGNGGHFQVVETGRLDSSGVFHSDLCVQNVVLLASAARTASTQSADQANTCYRGVLLHFSITAASGTGGLTLFVDTKDPLSGSYRQILAASVAITATGLKEYVIYPGQGSTVGDTAVVVIPVLSSIWRVRINAGDSSSYTYSVSADLLP